MLDIILILIFAVVIIFEIITKRKVPKEQISNETLTGNEKILTWFLCIFNPIIAGAILYYGWKKRLPTKAKQANQISLWAFFLALVLVVVLFMTGVIK